MADNAGQFITRLLFNKNVYVDNIKVIILMSIMNCPGLNIYLHLTDIYFCDVITFFKRYNNLSLYDYPEIRPFKINLSALLLMHCAIY